MSFDIFIGAFRDHERFEYDTAILEEIFRPLIAERYQDSWLLTTGTQIDIDSPRTDGFAVNRPPDDPLFWDALLEVLRRTPSVLYWPGCGVTACVADPAVIDHMPPDMVEALGRPVIVATGSEIGDAITRS